MFHRYIAKDVPYVETSQMAHGNEVHDALDKRLSAGTPLPNGMARFERWVKQFDGQKIQTEVKYGIRVDGTPCGFFDQDVWGRCKIDLILDPSDHTLRIFDWKTGKVREDPFELRLQALFAQSVNPEVRGFYGWYVWLGAGENGKLGVKHELGDIERTWAEVESMMHHIQANAAINHWPEREGALCRFCPVKQCQFNKNPS